MFNLFKCSIYVFVEFIFYGYKLNYIRSKVMKYISYISSMIIIK